MANDVYEMIIKINVNRDSVPGMGNTSKSWFDVFSHEIERIASNYEISVEEVEVSISRRGKELARAKDCVTLDEMVEAASQAWLQKMRSGKFPTYYLIDKGEVMEVNAKVGISGAPVWIDMTEGDHIYMVDEHLLSAERFSAKEWDLIGSFDLFTSKDDALAARDAQLMEG